MNRTLAAAVTLSLFSGCIYGYAKDSVTGAAIQSVSITVVKGNCAGSGCTTPNVQTTDTSGLFVFDAYGNHNGSSHVQIITAAAGEEAVQLSYTKAGYKTLTIFHRPRYETVTQNNQDYLISSVPTFFLCATNAPDADGDGLCDAAEAKYGTDANSADTDGDNISDFAELFGWGGVDLHAFGADPKKKDLFLEADYYPNRKPTANAIARVVAAFAAAPVSNPDGTTGIALHVNLDQQIDAADADPDLSLNVSWAEFDTIKNKYFAPRRAPFFHYLVFANKHSGDSWSGKSRGIPGHDFVVTLGAWTPPGGTELEQAGTMMHELGHNLGLQHGGNDSKSYKINYLSLMNYTYQVIGLRVDGVTEVLDYSRLKIGSVAENALSEPNAFSALAPTTEADLAHYSVMVSGVFRAGTASANLDFNGNGSVQPGLISYDLSGDGDTSDTTVASQNDWANLVFDGAGTIGDSNLGASLGLARAAPFFVQPEVTPPCLTAP